MSGLLPSMRKRLRVRRLHLTPAAILACVAGLRKDVVPLFAVWTWGRFLGIGPQPVKCFLENRNLAHNKADVRFYFVAWEWASTNHSHLSIPREISVKMSAVSLSSKASTSSMVARADSPKVESARASAST